MNSSDSAEEVIRIYLDEVAFVLKVAGEGTKNLIVFLTSVAKQTEKTNGKTRLKNLLKTGKELSIFTFNAEDLKKFSQEAKKYGILYCVLANKENEKIDGLVDVMVRKEDEAKVERIAERFNFVKIPSASVENLVEPKELKKDTRTEVEKEVDDLLSMPKDLEEIEISKDNTPSNSQSEKESQSESFSEITNETKPVVSFEKNENEDTEIKTDSIEKNNNAVEKSNTQNFNSTKSTKEKTKNGNVRKSVREEFKEIVRQMSEEKNNLKEMLQDKTTMTQEQLYNQMNYLAQNYNQKNTSKRLNKKQENHKNSGKRFKPTKDYQKNSGKRFKETNTQRRKNKGKIRERSK